ncbi:MAG TPA: F0F1 ATP synthase subunit B [bacterium]|nr:F0F1 ATP synthase subunit B [bacterium]HPT29850.1 F0F1 ATP synthase subunit B [bacterium]
MDSLISIFHIDWKILIAQIINFGIIFFVLYRFAFKPLSKMMNDRTKLIEKGLTDAKDIEKKLTQTNFEQVEVLNQAKKDALAIVEKANVQAEENKQKLVEKTKQEVAQIIVQEKAKIQAEKDSLREELKREMAELVILATEKVIGEKMDGAKDKELIAKIIK